MAAESFFEKVEKIKMPIRILILVGTVIVLAGAFTWAVYLPKTQDIAKTKKEIAGLKRKLNKAKIRAKKLKQFEAEFAQVDTQFKEALKLLPNTKEIPTLLKNITQLGTDSNLVFQLFKPGKEKTKNFYMEIPVSIKVTGPYHNVAVFFDRVGRMDRIVNIFNVSMKPVKKRSTTLTTTCNAVTYRFKGTSSAKKKKTKKKKK
ncbi:MAG: type 4a pilus biogenesis protein PilO [Deltaproteobacteria bacterium]|nr:type 4a pilus biogenesis protein PilO [Deltaproteobacteria bacterium]